jgi:hypothetical protein
MAALVALASVLALSSGLVKTLGKGRTPGSIPLFALLELIAGLGVPFYVLKVGPPPALTGTLVFLLVALVMVSSISRARNLKAERRRRELTESARLANYVNHLSALKEAGADPRSEND